MFHSARVKLTAWYLLIIMLVSIFFSIGIYVEANREFIRFGRFQQIKIEQERDDIILPSGPVQIRVFDPNEIAQARARVILTLLGINLGILGLAGFLGYFLAGRTLRPIQKMINEQNRFISDASHELRTPITGLKTATEVHLRNKQLSLLETKQLLASNLEEINHLQILTDDLMRLSLNEKMSEDFTFEVLPLQEILTTAGTRVAPLAKSKKIDVVLRKTNEKINGNKKTLVELFVILLDNAIKYSLKNSKITVSVERKEKKVVISVSDEGIGIPEADIDHIFDRFYRAEKSRSKNVVSGFGLGLAIAKKIVISHKGSISAHNNPKKGSTFLVVLPKSTV
ncbi:MAG: sensor histidine kinase [Candidatus Levyibacteriota bacterium]